MIIDSLTYNGKCACGKTHEMVTQFAVVESGCLKHIDEYLEKYHIKGMTVAVYDENTYQATADRHPNVDAEVVLSPDNLHANEHGVDLLMERLPKGAEVLLAVGSGTIHDITRYCAYQKNIEFVSCPTAASVDGFCSSVAAMTWHGCKKTLTAVAPKIVVADTDIIKEAPIYLARSGFGDMIGKYIALTDWKISHILTGEHYCDKIADMTFEATEAVVKAAEGIANRDEKAYESLMYGLLLSGLAMQMMGNSRPASGAEHHISHIIEMRPQGLGVKSEALHGEKVGVGTLISLEEYHKLAKLENIKFKDYETYDRTFFEKMYDAEMLKEILEENKKDAGYGVRAQQLEKCWPEICSVLEQLPQPDDMKAIYESLGVKTSLLHINVPERLTETLKEHSPTVRNRLTLMRLRKCFIMK